MSDHTQNDLFRLIFESSPVGEVVVNVDGQIVLVNAQAERLFGYGRGELIGLGIEALVPDRLRGQHVRDREAYSKNPPPKAMGAGRELFGRRRDGSEFPAEIGLTPVDGRPLITARVIDITERRRLEAALTALEHRTEFALDAAMAGTWELNLANGAVRWSRSMERVFGVPLARFPTTDAEFFDHVLPLDREALRSAVHDAIRSSGEVRLDSRIVWPDGSVRWIATAARAFSSAAGRPLLVLGLAMNITDRKRLEAQYLQAQKLESVGRLAGGIAHDFNNLLTVMLGNVAIARDIVGAASDAHPSLAEVEEAAERAATLTRQLLAFSRRQVLDPRVIDLNGIVAENDGFLRRLLGEDIDLQVRLVPEPTHVRVDPGYVQQVIMNLAVNARDAMPGGGRLTIQTDTVDLGDDYVAEHLGVKPGRYVRLLVSDTGAGMSAETRARVFEPFFTTKEAGKGTGLGLSVVHGIVQQSGGHIEVYSEAGLGTTFKIYLPIVYEAETPVTVPAVVVELRGDETILVVEDEDGVRRLASRILASHGYRVLTAPSGGEAVQLVSEHRTGIDLILTDLVMPGMSGPEMVETVRTIVPAVRILYTSGYMGDTMARHGILDTDVAFLPKPYTPTTLLGKIREVLSRTG